MIENIIYTNKFFELAEIMEEYLIRVYRAGFQIVDMKDLLIKWPQLDLISFNVLKESLETAQNQWRVIGKKKARIEIMISNDSMRAYIKFNYTEEELAQMTTEAMVEMAIKHLEKENVIFGYDDESIRYSIENHLEAGKEIMIAQGRIPTEGQDAIVRYYELSERKPKIAADGQANYYEMNLINSVDQGEWLGERIEPVKGQEGKTILGKSIPSQMGLQRALNYDKKSVKAIKSDDQTMTYLYAKRPGAVSFEQEKISVLNYLEIKGSVSFNTGNIDFDGYVGVAESVDDNFTVKADKDIQVMGNMGIGAVNCIESREGNIHIRGGISGKNHAKIVCQGDFYTKYAANCDIECSGTVHVSVYLLNCNIKAKQVILESSKSKIMGGSIEADIKVVAGEIGSVGGLRTIVKINGYNRQEIKNRYQQIDSLLNRYDEKLKTLKKEVKIFNLTGNLKPHQEKQLMTLQFKMEKMLEDRKRLVKNREQMKSYLLTKGEGEIKALSCIHEKVMFDFKGTRRYILPSSLAMSYYCKNNDVVSE